MGTSSQSRADLGRMTALGIAWRMEALDWDYERLAAESGIEWGTLVSYRADASEMRMNELAAVAAALGTEPSALMVEAATREQFDCPDWCVRVDHSPGEEPALHYGPAFGAAWPQGADTEALAIDIDEEAVRGLTVEQARDLSDDLLEAIQWLGRVR